MKNYDELIDELTSCTSMPALDDAAFRWYADVTDQAAAAIKELIAERDEADREYQKTHNWLCDRNEQRDEVTKQRDELVDILVFSRRTLNYYDCNTEEWSVAEERCLRRESIRMIDAALAKIKESK